MNKIMHAQCLCGTTQFDVDLVNYQVHVCHCSLCRRQSSGLLMTIDVKPESLVFLNRINWEFLNHRNGRNVVFASNVGPLCFGVCKIIVIVILMCLRWMNCLKS